MSECLLIVETDRQTTARRVLAQTGQREAIVALFRLGMTSFKNLTIQGQMGIRHGAKRKL